MLSKNQRKQILQLSQKKHRVTQGLFVAEGAKVVTELLDSAWEFVSLFAIEPEFHSNAEKISWEEMKQITHFKTASPVLGVFKIRAEQPILGEPITLAVDGVRDPGNLGTLIRLCDWFGLSELICSQTTVDCYNTKVIQASMGSMVRVHCHYVRDLGTTLVALNKPMYGAAAREESIYKTKLPEKASFVFGSESHGISGEVSAQLSNLISIPNFRNGNQAESLNVATAAAIVLSEIFRAR